MRMRTNRTADSALSGLRGRLREAWDALLRRTHAAGTTGRRRPAGFHSLRESALLRDYVSRGWYVVSDLIEVEDFTEADRLTLAEKSVKLYRQGDPMARCIITTYTALTMGGGLRVSFSDPDHASWWRRFESLNAFQAKVQAAITRAYLEGECFLRVFGLPMSEGEAALLPSGKLVNGAGGSGSGGGGSVPRVVLVPSRRVEIEHDPDDFETVLSYVITSPSGEKKAKVRPQDMFHLKFDPLGLSRRGWPVLAPVLKDLRRYEQWLTARLLLNVIRASVPLVQYVSEATPEEVQELAAKFTKMPNPGSVITLPDTVKLQYPDLKIDSSDTRDDGRAWLTRIAQGVGLERRILELDFDTSRIKQAFDPNSPTIKMFQSYRLMFLPVIERLVERVTGLEVERDFTVRFLPIVQGTLQSDAQGAGVLIANRVMSRQTAATQMGLDWQQERERIERETAWLRDQKVSKEPGNSPFDPEVLSNRTPVENPVADLEAEPAGGIANQEG